MPAIAAWQVWRLVLIVRAVDGTTFIAMQPRTVTTESDEIPQREFGIFHIKWLHCPSAYADGTDFMPVQPLMIRSRNPVHQFLKPRIGAHRFQIRIMFQQRFVFISQSD